MDDDAVKQRYRIAVARAGLRSGRGVARIRHYAALQAGKQDDEVRKMCEDAGVPPGALREEVVKSARLVRSRRRSPGRELASMRRLVANATVERSIAAAANAADSKTSGPSEEAGGASSAPTGCTE